MTSGLWLLDSVKEPTCPGAYVHEDLCQISNPDMSHLVPWLGSSHTSHPAPPTRNPPTQRLGFPSSPPCFSFLYHLVNELSWPPLLSLFPSCVPHPLPRSLLCWPCSVWTPPDASSETLPYVYNTTLFLNHTLERPRAPFPFILN